MNISNPEKSYAAPRYREQSVRNCSGSVNRRVRVLEEQCGPTCHADIQISCMRCSKSALDLRREDLFCRAPANKRGDDGFGDICSLYT